MFPHVAHRRVRENWIKVDTKGENALVSKWTPKLYLPIAGPRHKSLQLGSSKGMFRCGLILVQALNSTHIKPALSCTLNSLTMNYTFIAKPTPTVWLFPNRNCNSGGFGLSPIDSTEFCLNVCGSLGTFPQQVTPHCHSNLSKSFGALWKTKLGPYKRLSTPSIYFFSSVPLPVKAFIKQNYLKIFRKFGFISQFL